MEVRVRLVIIYWLGFLTEEKFLIVCNKTICVSWYVCFCVYVYV